MSDTTKHTPGPWTIEGDDRTLIGAGDGQEMVAEALYGHTVPHWARSKAEAQANARRIVACVNACEGIAEPEALRELVEVVKAVEWSGRARNEITGTMLRCCPCCEAFRPVERDRAVHEPGCTLHAALAKIEGEG